MSIKRDIRKKAAIVALPRAIAKTQRWLLEAQALEVLPTGRVRVLTVRGQEVECRCAHAIDLSWLSAAVEVGPVDAEVSVTSDELGSLLAVFPGPEHKDVKPESLKLAATDRIDIECGASSLRLTKGGRAQLRGRDVLARGSRAARLQGGTTRLN